jgi:4-amino-4-deoxychorismate lyase
LSGTVTALVNGRIADVLSLHDRGLQYGDGLFETIACRAGVARWLDRHLYRLALGCERLAIPMPEVDVLRAEIGSLAAGQHAAVIKLLLTRGESQGRGYRPTGGEQPMRVLSRHPWPPAPTPPFRALLSPVRLGSQPLLAGLKHLNRLEQVLAQQAARQACVDEGLQCDSEGYVVSASAANLFVATGDGWLTPPIRDCGVAGVLRSLVFELAPRIGLVLREERVRPDQVAAAPHLCLSNVRLGLQAVHWYEGRELAVDPHRARLQELIDVS